MLKLLIVDDSNIIRSRIERLYVNNDAISVVGKASNGRMAIQLMKELKPDIVTMDLTMPNLGGIECIEQLIAFDATIKILVVSALSDKATGIEALTRGARGFLSKPFTDERLEDALNKVINTGANNTR